MSQDTLSAIASANMSGPELYALLAAGYEPIGVVIGVAAISMGSRGFGRSIRAIFNKGEMTAISQTSAEARRTALARAGEEARLLNADMILVSTWDVRDIAEIVEVTCTATALRKKGDFKAMPIATATS
jgi:uncharacterized protein YbjQ (UPF0145 family)